MRRPPVRSSLTFGLALCGVEGCVVTGCEAPRNADRALAYIRVSKAREEMISPENQWHEIESYAKRHAMHIVEVIEDLHKTGRDFEKRAIGQISGAIKAGHYSVVLLWKWSRWGRNVKWSAVYLTNVEEAGGRVRAVTEDIDPTTAVGRFTRTQLLAIAEFQSDQIGESWKETQKNRRRRGLPHTNAPRFGYTNTPQGYTPCPVTGPIVVELYRRYVAGESMRSLMFWLNDRGIKTTQGTEWQDQTLRRMLDTGFAAGWIREQSKPMGAYATGPRVYDVWRKGSHEPLITDECFEAYKGRRDRNRALPKRVVNATHEVSGLVYCAECDNVRMVASYSGAHRKHAWVCPRGRNQRLHDAVTGSNLRLLAKVEEWLHAGAAGDLSVATATAEARMRSEQTMGDIDEIEARIRKIRRNIANLDDMREEGDIDKNDYRKRKAARETELRAAEAARYEAQQKIGVQSIDFTQEFQTVLDVWHAADAEQRNRLLQTVVSRIVVRPGQDWSGDKVRIVGRWEA